MPGEVPLLPTPERLKANCCAVAALRQGNEPPPSPGGEDGLDVRELMALTETENRNVMDKPLFKKVKEDTVVSGRLESDLQGPGDARNIELSDLPSSLPEILPGNSDHATIVIDL